MWEFLQSTYGKVSFILGAVAAIWGGCKAAGALKLWVKARLDKRRERMERPQKILDLLADIKRESEATDSQQAQQLAALSLEVQTVKVRLDKNADQTSTLQCEKLNWGYFFYGKQHHPIPMQTLISLEKMYKQYKGDLPEGQERNHVPADWMDVIHTAPIAGA